VFALGSRHREAGVSVEIMGLNLWHWVEFVALGWIRGVGLDSESRRWVGFKASGWVRFDMSAFSSLGFSSTHPPSTLCKIRMVRGEERVK